MSTKPKRISQSKAWAFTLNNWTDEEYGDLVCRFSKSKHNIQWIIGKEIGPQGTPHLQGYICSQDRFRPLPEFAILREQKQCVHFEKARKGVIQNYNYCSKDGDFRTNIRHVPSLITLDDKIIRVEQKIKSHADKISEIKNLIPECYQKSGVDKSLAYDLYRTLTKNDMDQIELLTRDLEELLIMRGPEASSQTLLPQSQLNQ